MATNNAPLTPERLSEIRALWEAAGEITRLLCMPLDHPDRLIWRMSIPARPNTDPDLVIGSALSDIPDLLAEVERLNVELAEALRYKRAFEWLEARRPEVRPDIVDEDEDGLPTPDMLGLPVDSDFWRIKHHGDDATRRLDVMGVRLLEAVEAAMQEAPRG